MKVIELLTPIKSIKVDEGTYPYLEISDIDVTNKKYSFKDKTSVSGAVYSYKNNILVSTVRPTRGAITFVNDEKIAVSNAFAILNVNDKICLPKYLFYSLNSKFFLDYLGKNSKGATYPTCSKDDVYNYDIKYVDYSKQIEIVNVLNNVYRQIEIKTEQLAEYEQLIKSRFVEMFGDPIVNDKKWKQVNLKKLAIKIMSGNTPKGGSQVYVDDGIMFFRSQNVWKNKIEIGDIAYIDEKTHKKMSRSSLKHKDILMTKTGRINTENSSLGRAAMYLGEDDKANINGHVYMIRLNEIAAKEFVLFIITTNEYRDYIRSVCVGGIDKRQLNKDHIEDFPIILPPRSLQDDFVKFIRQIDKLKFSVQASLEETQKLFDSLMQKYFG